MSRSLTYLPQNAPAAVGRARPRPDDRQDLALERVQGHRAEAPGVERVFARIALHPHRPRRRHAGLLLVNERFRPLLNAHGLLSTQRADGGWDETEFTGRLRVHIVDPGATRTRMRALAFPGEEPESLKPPEVVADAIVARLLSDVPTGERLRVDA